MAYVKRLIALQLRRKIDAEAARRRKAATRGRASNGQGKPQYRGRFEQLRQEALAELAEAAAIYEQYENHHGLGSVHLNYAISIWTTATSNMPSRRRRPPFAWAKKSVTTS